MKLYVVLLIFGLLVLEPVKTQDGGCTATGMRPYDYAQALCMSGLFYEAQRSGYLPSDNRVPWRGDSALSDGFDNGVDLVGGYYDAGDFVKFGLPGAYSVTALAWGLIQYPYGYAKAGETHHGRATLRWGAEYLLKAATGPTKFWGQVADANVDHAYWGRPEDMTMKRPSYVLDTSKPGSIDDANKSYVVYQFNSKKDGCNASYIGCTTNTLKLLVNQRKYKLRTDIAAEAAAALAATSIVFSRVDSRFAQQCLRKAKDLFNFADQYREISTNSIPNLAKFYPSYSYEDELAWGALWLYKATSDQHYLTKAKDFINEFGILYYARNMNWDSKQPGIYALAAELDGGPDYVKALSSYVDAMMNQQQKTPKGLIYFNPWGTLGEALNVAFILMRASTLPIRADPNSVRSFAQSQADYALGRTGRSFVVGFGVNPPVRPHHVAASCPDPPIPCDRSYQYSPNPNPHVIFGAVVGGPDKNDRYTDNREDYIQNEVAIDYNALYTGLLAALVELH